MAEQPSDAGKVPAAIVAIREKLKALGQEVTVENMQKFLAAVELNRANGAMRYALGKTDYKQEWDMAGNKRKREWLTDFVLDFDLSKCIGRNSTSRTSVEGERGRLLWLTEEQMASPVFWNSATHAKLLAAQAPSRPSQYKALREAGVK